ncbi:alpha/beta hydrolase fold domain-containing protein [Marinomonas sp. IMCC 4694]|uniref:alpha/beta hydrolase fold domain-containing protein n=1 Tax=Marinomonas sp. IMCC 4694 TaxID=2605432 RepID=UPI0011E67217|nr:alpha/beta hydrolase fold domain-containing protein [Marinomonas sp. IMCC 4694]TYL49239.1 alpha/beta hydrolase fold domain-containing protein [Marinomonas sp. IMCC 4694]
MSNFKQKEKKSSWKQDPEKVKADIVYAATSVFAEFGFTGTRLDDIAAKTNTSKRMVYYYFGDKAGLYKKVLESVYKRINDAEDQLDLMHLDPVTALTQMVSLLFDHNRQHPELVRLLMIENIHQARTLKNSQYVRSLRNQARSKLEQIYQQGVNEGRFRPHLDPIKIRWIFGGLSFFNVSNKPSFSTLFGDELWQDNEQVELKQQLIDVVLRYVMVTPNNALNAPIKREDKRMINPEIQQFLTVWEQKWSGLAAGATPDDRRRYFELIAHQMRLPTPEQIDTHEVHWIESESGPVRVRLFRDKRGGVQPCLLYLHGGAWMQGSPETHWDITSRIAAANGQTVISVDYAKAPERPFPAAINQCDAVARWAFAHAETLGIDTQRVTVGGDSAGANLAAALTLDMRGTDVQFIGQLLIYPACDFDQSRPSYKENPDGPIIQVKGMNQVNAMYSPNQDDLYSNPRLAPLLAADHQHLPSAYIAVAQYDPLRDSGYAYAETLRAANVTVKVDDGLGLIHGYLRSMEYCQAARESLDDMCRWLKDLNENTTP